jgi:hypothetical protein
MSEQQINRISGKVLVVLSLIALLSGYFQPPQPDEGTAAHIFQFSIVALPPTILLFLATADWRTPLQSTRRLAFPAATLAVAFGALYFLEHYRQISSLCLCDSVAFLTPARATFRMPA